MIKLLALNITFVILLMRASVFAQSAEIPPANWQNPDLKHDSIFAISMDRAFDELLSGKKALPVIVAVIDGGVDIDHEGVAAAIRGYYPKLTAFQVKEIIMKTVFKRDVLKSP